jgi:NAD-dependent dihydropyrimidine dehydrogenase PreA subunit
MESWREEKRKVVFIMGVGHSGSTLLELLLSSHPRVFGLGELANLRGKIDVPHPDMSHLCSICEEGCPYWNDRAQLSILKTYFSYRNPLTFLPRQGYRLYRSIYRYLFDWFDHEILIDSSKRASWIRRQLWPNYHWRTISPVLLYITRDPRGVVNSYLRKYPKARTRAVARNWKNNVQQMDHFYQQFNHAKQRVSYETLASEPEATLCQLCDFLEIDYQPEMLAYWQHDHHLCNGNLGTRSLIYRYRAEFGLDGVTWQGSQRELRVNHGDYYERIGLAIKLDTRWRDELTPEQLAVINKTVGKMKGY